MKLYTGLLVLFFAAFAATAYAACTDSDRQICERTRAACIGEMPIPEREIKSNVCACWSERFKCLKRRGCDDVKNTNNEQFPSPRDQCKFDDGCTATDCQIPANCRQESVEQCFSSYESCSAKRKQRSANVGFEKAKIRCECVLGLEHCLLEKDCLNEMSERFASISSTEECTAHASVGSTGRPYNHRNKYRDDVNEGIDRSTEFLSRTFDPRIQGPPRVPRDPQGSRQAHRIQVIEEKTRLQREPTNDEEVIDPLQL